MYRRDVDEPLHHSLDVGFGDTVTGRQPGQFDLEQDADRIASRGPVRGQRIRDAGAVDGVHEVEESRRAPGLVGLQVANQVPARSVSHLTLFVGGLLDPVTVARGIDFQLGLWMHGYERIDSPKPNYTIEGLTRETHGPYCRDAVRALLKACPAIGGITFRIHGESGVEEGSYDFWKTVFDGVATCGRQVEIDMHAKGMDETMLNLAVATRMPVKVSPKYWAEHMGMPYHQADIRELEQPRAGRTATATCFARIAHGACSTESGRALSGCSYGQIR